MLLRAAAFLLSLAMLPSFVMAQSRAVEHSPLEGVRNVRVGVAVFDDMSGVVSKETLQTLVELRLRAAGLHIVSPEVVADPSRTPIFDVIVRLEPVGWGEEKQYVYCVTVAVDITGRSPLDQSSALVMLSGPYTLMGQGSKEDIEFKVDERAVGGLLKIVLGSWPRLDRTRTR